MSIYFYIHLRNGYILFSLNSFRFELRFPWYIFAIPPYERKPNINFLGFKLFFDFKG